MKYQLLSIHDQENLRDILENAKMGVGDAPSKREKDAYKKLIAVLREAIKLSKTAT